MTTNRDFEGGFKHEGVMVCNCNFELADQSWPLSEGIRHIDSKCRWSCCDAVWKIHNCSARKFGVGGSARVDVSEVSYGVNCTMPSVTCGAAPYASIQSGGSNTYASGSSALGTYASGSSASGTNAAGSSTSDTYATAAGANSIGLSCGVLQPKWLMSCTAPTDADVQDVPMNNEIQGLSPSRLAVGGNKPGARLSFTIRAAELKAATKAETKIYLVPVLENYSSFNEQQGDDITYDDVAPETGFLCNAAMCSGPPNKRMFNNAMCFMSPEFPDQELLTGKMDDGQFKRLVAMNVAQYMKMLNLSPSEKRNPEMIAAWLLSGCNTWIRVAGDNDISEVRLLGGVNGSLNEFTAEFEKDERGRCSHEEALMKASVDGRITERNYMDWYVICRYFEAIVPPVMSGLPLFSVSHTSAVSKVLKAQPELFASYYGLKTPGGQTFDSFIKMSVDGPGSAAGCVAGDEETYPTFEMFTKEMIAILGTRKNISYGFEETKTEMTINGGGDSLSWGHNGRCNLNASNLVLPKESTFSCVLSFTVTGRRNIRGYRFPSTTNRSERKTVEKILRTAITASSYGGNYLIGKDITPEILTPTSEVGSEIFTKDWPHHRLLFTNVVGNINMIVNHIDHLYVKVSGAKGEFDVKNILNLYGEAMNGVEKELNERGHSYVHDDTFGYHTSHPHNLGTAMVAIVEMYLPNLIQKSLAAILERLGLIHTVTKGSIEGVCEISHKHRMNCSEVEQVQTLIDGVQILAALESLALANKLDSMALMIKNLPDPYVGTSVIDSKDIVKVRLPSPTGWSTFSSDDMPEYGPEHKSIVAKLLTPNMYKTLSQAAIEAPEWTFSEAIKGSLENPSGPVGILLGGESSYQAYAPLLASVISELHSGFNCATMVQPSIDPNLRELNYWVNHSENVQSPYILSATICASRNIYSYPMVCAADRQSKRAVDFILKSAFQKKSRELKGTYYTLGDISASERAAIASDPTGHMLPTAPLRCSDGQDGRGYFRSADKKVFAWVNQEDHLKLFVRDNGSINGSKGSVDLKNMIRDWARALVLVENIMEPSGFCFMHSERLGYVTSCPSNLGTAMRITVTVRLSALAPTLAEAAAMGNELNVSFLPNASGGGNNWDLTNTIVLGYSEVEILENFFFSLATIIALEVKATPGSAPVASPVVCEIYSGLSDAELKYIKDNEMTRSWVQRVSRSVMPVGSIEKYALRIDISSHKALVGAWVDKKLHGNMFRANRFMWIDHLTKSLHWARTSDKASAHKALKLDSVLRIGTAPRGALRTVTDPFYGKAPSEIRFDRPDNSIRLHLAGYDKLKDIHLPPGISDADRQDWITILLDICGFKNWEAATLGRSYDESKDKIRLRDLSFRGRPLGLSTNSPRNGGASPRIGTPNGLESSFSSMDENSPGPSDFAKMSLDKLLLAEQGVRGNPIVINQSQTQVKFDTPTIRSPSMSFPTSPVSAQAPSMSFAAPSINAQVPSMSYAAPSMNAQAPSMSYAAPSMNAQVPSMSYAAPSMNAQAPSMSYAAPSMSSIIPSMSFAAPSINTQAPSMSFAASSINTQAPSMSLAASSINTQAPSVSYAAPSINTQAPSMSYAAPSMNAQASSMSFAAPSMNAQASSMSFAAPSINTQAPSMSFAAPSMNAFASSMEIRASPPAPIVTMNLTPPKIQIGTQ